MDEKEENMTFIAEMYGKAITDKIATDERMKKTYELVKSLSYDDIEETIKTFEELKTAKAENNPFLYVAQIFLSRFSDEDVRGLLTSFIEDADVLPYEIFSGSVKSMMEMYFAGVILYNHKKHKK